MPKTLTAQQVAQYEQNGVLFPIRVLTPQEVSRFRRGCDELEEALGGRPKSTDLKKLHLCFRWAYDLATHPAVLDAVEDVLGPDLLLWSTALFTKYPHDPAYISWHQDGCYWNLDPPKLATAWIALTPSHDGNGSMRVVPGSHAQGIHKHNATFAEHNMLTQGQEVSVAVKDEEAVSIVLRPGEMSLHHAYMIHGSRPNSSDEKRVGFACRYLASSVRVHNQKPAVVLARGTLRHDNVELEKPMPSEDFAGAFAALKGVTDRLEGQRRAMREATARANA